MRTKKFLAMAIALGLAVGATAMPTLAAEKKTLVFGDTTFNAENEEADINPQNTYAGWACIRYGVGETLFRYSDTMEIEPWIAKEYENIDELTWKITPTSIPKQYFPIISDILQITLNYFSSRFFARFA